MPELIARAHFRRSFDGLANASQRLDEVMVAAAPEGVLRRHGAGFLTAPPPDADHG